MEIVGHAPEQELFEPRELQACRAHMLNFGFGEHSSLVTRGYNAETGCVISQSVRCHFQ